MRATVSTLLKSGKVKTIAGNVMQRSMGKITLIVTDRDGQQRIKSFNESKHTVRVFE